LKENRRFLVTADNGVRFKETKKTSEQRGGGGAFRQRTTPLVTGEEEERQKGEWGVGVEKRKMFSSRGTP